MNLFRKIVPCLFFTTLLCASLDAQSVRFRLLQINDIYEIGPLSGGKEGGPARVAEYRKKLQKQNIPLTTILAGDFVSPSVMNNVEYQGKKIKGAQLIDVLNSVGVDLVTFGNHEFDLKESELQDRINESRFKWISANVFQKSSAGIQPFYKMVDNKKEYFLPCTTYVYRNTKGDSLRVGFLAVTLQGFKPAYAEITSFREAARKYADTLLIRDKADILIALSHLNIEEDRLLAQAVPELKLIMGGHEHQNHKEFVGTVMIAKADANVRSAYVHDFKVRKNAKDPVLRTSQNARLVKITDRMKDDPATVEVAGRWKKIANDAFKSQGFNPDALVLKTEEALDGLEASVRNKETNLGIMIAEAFKASCPGTLAGILNSGSIRIDDQISGNITEYDVLRILPFGGKVVSVEMKGSTLQKFLTDGRNNKGSGGFLQYAGVEYRDEIWYISGKEIQAEEWYPVAITDFLLTGQEKNMSYIKSDNPEIRNIKYPEAGDLNSPARDVRIAVIEYLRSTSGK